MALYSWSVGDRITAARLSTPYNLLKGVAGGTDTITLISGSAFDMSACQTSSGFKPPAVAGAAPTAAGVLAYDATAQALVWGNGTATKKALTSLVYGSTYLQSSAVLSTSAWSTVMDLPIASGLWMARAVLQVMSQAVSTNVYTAQMIDNVSSAVIDEASVWTLIDTQEARMTLCGILDATASTNTLKVRMRVQGSSGTITPTLTYNPSGSSKATHLEAFKIG